QLLRVDLDPVPRRDAARVRGELLAEAPVAPPALGEALDVRDLARVRHGARAERLDQGREARIRAEDLVELASGRPPVAEDRVDAVVARGRRRPERRPPHGEGSSPGGGRRGLRGRHTMKQGTRATSTSATAVEVVSTSCASVVVVTASSVCTAVVSAISAS